MILFRGLYRKKIDEEMKNKKEKLIHTSLEFLSLSQGLAPYFVFQKSHSGCGNAVVAWRSSPVAEWVTSSGRNTPTPSPTETPTHISGRMGVSSNFPDT